MEWLLWFGRTYWKVHVRLLDTLEHVASCILLRFFGKASLVARQEGAICYADCGDGGKERAKMDFPCNNKIMDSIMKLWCPARGDQQYSKNKRGFETFSKIKKSVYYYCSTTRKIRLCNSINEILFRFSCIKSPFW